ncbi:MAG: hypothetical protein AB1625_03530 [Acidobacteriota bacterium]
MTNRHAVHALATLAIAVAAADAQQRPTPTATHPIAKPANPEVIKAAYDLKALNIGTTGAPSYIPVFTFKNVGTKPITQTVRFWYKFEGTLVTWKDIPPSQPGETIVVKGGGSDGGFGRYGSELEVFADCDDLIKEKDENNNHLKKKLTMISRPPITPLAIPQP